jgi:hypothetical protein
MVDKIIDKEKAEVAAVPSEELIKFAKDLVAHVREWCADGCSLHIAHRMASIIERLLELLAQHDELKDKIEKTKEGLKRIINHYPVYYNGVADRAGDMEKMARILLAYLEKN